MADLEIRLSRFLIAVVEDDDSIREALEDLFESVGYQVVLFCSAEDFLRADRLQEIGCLISDVGLPGMSGIELLRLVRVRRPGLRVIIITASSEASLLNTASSAGADRVFVKPLSRAELLEAIVVAP
jgi:FixJ family two-component response regulator